MDAADQHLGSESGVVDRLRSDLARRAHQEGLVDATVAYLDTTYLDTSVGRLLLAATGDGLVRVAFESEGHGAVLAHLAGAVGPRILRDDIAMAPYAEVVTAHLDGRLQGADVPLDLDGCGGFRREVLEYLRTIPVGETRSYAEVAREVGRPRAVRAVGTACATNPLPLIIPCHRVVRSDGSVGNYLGGVEVKRRLLAAERSMA